MKKDKTIIIVNGQGESGKTTLCKYFCNYYNGMLISMITPIKQKAKRLGWKGTKSLEDREFLNELKLILNKRFQECDVYIRKMVKTFDEGDKKVLFIEMREPDDIDRFRKEFLVQGFRVKTLLIKRGEEAKDFGNAADDGVFNYYYDYIFENDEPIEAAHNAFVIMIKHAVFDEEGEKE